MDVFPARFSLNTRAENTIVIQVHPPQCGEASRLDVSCSTKGKAMCLTPMRGTGWPDPDQKASGSGGGPWIRPGGGARLAGPLPKASDLAGEGGLAGIKLKANSGVRAVDPTREGWGPG